MLNVVASEEKKNDLHCVRFATSPSKDAQALADFHGLLSAAPVACKKLTYLVLIKPTDSTEEVAQTYRNAHRGFKGLTVLCGPSLNELTEPVTQAGLDLSLLPTKVGGQLVPPDMAQWLRTLRKMEQQQQFQQALEQKLKRVREQNSRAERVEVEAEDERKKLKREKEEFHRLQDTFLSLSATKLRLGEENRMLQETLQQLHKFLTPPDLHGGDSAQINPLLAQIATLLPAPAPTAAAVSSPAAHPVLPPPAEESTLSQVLDDLRATLASGTTLEDLLSALVASATSGNLPESNFW